MPSSVPSSSDFARTERLRRPGSRPRGCRPPYATTVRRRSPRNPARGATIGIVYVPRFGADYTRPIVQGTTPAVLDILGLGHYEGTAMPGAVGNLAVAGHRQTHGAVLDNIDALVPGDRIYVQTRDGYYVYVFRNSEIVLPSRTDVLLPVPTQPAATPTERYLTMTSCNPRFGSQERIIAYSLLEHWQPASAGPPPEIAGQVQARLRGGLSRVRLDLPAFARSPVASHCHRAGVGRRRAGIDGSVPFSLDGTIHPVH